MKKQNVSRSDRAHRLLGKAPEPNLWNLGWPAVEERNRNGQWLRAFARAARLRELNNRRFG